MPSPDLNTLHMLPSLIFTTVEDRCSYFSQFIAKKTETERVLKTKTRTSLTLGTYCPILGLG